MIETVIILVVVKSRKVAVGPLARMRGKGNARIVLVRKLQ